MLEFLKFFLQVVTNDGNYHERFLRYQRKMEGWVSTVSSLFILF